MLRRLIEIKQVPWLVLVVSLAATTAFWHHSVKHVLEDGKVRFHIRAEECRDRIIERMRDYKVVLRGGVGLFDASDEVSRESWRAYVKALQIEQHFPGTQGIGFSKRIHPHEKASHVRRIRAEGFPGYSIRPEGERSEYTSIIYLEPFSGRNLRAFGYDMLSETVRRAAMERARDEGTPTLSGKVILVQETDKEKQNGVLLLVPVYRRGMPNGNVEERRAALTGYVYSPLRVNDLMEGILGKAVDENDIVLFDGKGETAETFLYANGAERTAAKERGAFRSAYRETFPFDLYGRTWTIRVGSLPPFEAMIERNRHYYVLWGGVGISFLLFGITFVLALRYKGLAKIEKAEEALREVNARLETRVLERTSELSKANESLHQEIVRRIQVEEELRSREAELVEAQRVGSVGSWSLDPKTGKVTWSEELFRIFGRDPGQPPPDYEEHPEILTPESLEEMNAAIEKTVRDGGSYDIELEITRPDGTGGWINARGEARRDADGRIIGIRGTALDISERKNAEVRIRKSLTLETSLRRIDEKILSGADFKEALEIVCDAIKDMGYGTCWIGLAEPDFSVRVIASRGFDQDHLGRMEFRWDDSPEGSGPTGIAIRTGRPYVCPDIHADRNYAPWRSEAVTKGHRSSVAVPMRSEEGNTLGVLHVYGKTEKGITPEDIHTLETFARQCTLALVSAKRIGEIRKGIRILSALREVDRDILRGADVQETLGVICETIVGMGYRLCWVGMAEPDYSVRVAAVRGVEEDALADMTIRWDDSLQGCGPSGQVIKTGKTFLSRNILENNGLAPWKDKVLEWGLRSLASLPLKSDEGDAIGVLHVYSDQENRFAAEDVGDLETFARQCTVALVNAKRIEELRTVHHRLSSHIERMPLGYIEHDGDFRIAGWNPASERIFGWSAGEAMGKHPFDLFVPPEMQPHVSGFWSKLREGGESSNDSAGTAIRKDGTTVDCEWFSTALRDATGAMTGLLTLVHDVTERKRLEKQLRVAQKMESVGTLAGGIAHDFNNALTGIVGFGELLRGRMAGNEDALHDLDEILHCAERAATLTRQLLAYARRQVIDPVHLNLSTTVADLMKLIGKVVGEHIEVRTSLEKNVPTIHADRGQIEQVVMNLCLNARDAMPNGGKLLVDTGDVHLEEEYVHQNPYMRTGRYAVLTVSDTGVGMDEKTRERVFDPFFTTKGPDKGTGLGLAMVYGIVKQHGGFIHLYSEPGKGTAFKVYFPAIEAPPDGVPAQRREEVVRGGRETILLAEDEEVIRSFAERTLIELGYTVLVARNGEEAIGLFRQNKEIALAVLDVVMPRKGGEEAYEEMRRQNPRLKVIFMSGYTSNGIHDSFVLNAGKPFLQKPFGPAILANRIREVLDTR